MSENRTGKKIYELDDLATGIKLKDEAWFAVSQDELTYRVQMHALRSFINGDDKDPSVENYYSSQKIFELFEIARIRFEAIEQSIVVTNIRIDNLTNTVQNNYATLDNRITEEVRILNNRITNEVNILNNRITNEVNILNQKIKDEQTARINADNAINIRIDNETAAREAQDTVLLNRIIALEQRLTDLIKVGTTPPSAAIVKEGQVYVQIF